MSPSSQSGDYLNNIYGYKCIQIKPVPSLRISKAGVGVNETWRQCDNRQKSFLIRLTNTSHLDFTLFQLSNELKISSVG